MDKLLKRIKLIVLGFVVVLVLLTVFGIFNPLQKLIESEKLSSFVTSSKLYAHALSEKVETSYNKTALIGNDYNNIRNLNNYNSGSLSEVGLVVYFNAVFESIVNNNDDIIYVYLNYGTNKSITKGTQIETVTLDDDFKHVIIKKNDKLYLKTIYDINSYEFLGTLVVYYDIDDIFGFESLLNLNVYDNRDVVDLYRNTAKSVKSGSDLLYYYQGNYHYINQIPNSNIYYAIDINAYQLMGKTTQVVQYTILFLILVFVLAYVMFNRSVFLKAHYLVEQSNRMRKEIAKAADYDSLTNAYSRSFFDRYIKRFKDLYDEDFTATLVMVDFDDLKGINDKFGHLVGDQVLKQISELIHDSLRKNDYFFRFGGDEFIIILADCDEELATQIINRIINHIKKENENLNHTMSISYGISSLNYNSNLLEVIHKADKNMYENKKQNKKNNNEA